MEFSAKPVKSASNIYEVVSKFTKVCRLRSIGVLSSENSNHPDHHRDYYNNASNMEQWGDDSGQATAGISEYDGEKMHPHSVDIETRSNECGHLEIFKLFDTISALKVAYVQLQEAHIPYDPDKIRSADQLIVSHLEILCKIKGAYNENQLKKIKSISARSAPLLSEIKVQEKLLQKLKSQSKGKDVEKLNLQKLLKDLDLKNRKLAEDLRRREKVNARLVNSYSFQDIFKEVSKGIHDFAKPLIALMKVSGWDLDRAANAIEDSVVYTKRSHKKYAFEAYIARIMFYDVSFNPYNVAVVMRFDDPLDVLMEEPNSAFGSFCIKKYLLLVHPRLEASFFGNLDHRTLISSGRHPRTAFYQAFVKMSRWVWILLAMAASTEPKPELFRVKRGNEYSNLYMESVVEFRPDKEETKFKVELLVTPGFRIGDTLVKPRVYISESVP